MGLGLHIAASIKPVGLLRRKPSQQEIFTKIEQFFRQTLRDDGIEIFDARASEEELSIEVYPTAEHVYFSFDQKGLLVCSAKTSGGGPGYHASLVDKLDRLAKELGVQWIWDEGEDFMDETGYALHRDFRKLEHEMREFFIGFAGMIDKYFKEAESRNLCLNFPLNFRVNISSGAASPLGLWDEAFFQEILSRKDDEAGLVSYAERFFPWWRQEKDALYWKNLGLSLFWMEVMWRPYFVNERLYRERATFALKCFTRAKEMDPGVEVPEAEISELRELLKFDIETSTEPLPIPKTNRIGFFRLPQDKLLPGGWRAAVPGYFYEKLEKDNTTQVNWYGTKTIRSSSFTIDYDRSKPSPAEEVIEEDRQKNEIIADIQKGKLVGVAYEKYIPEQESEDGQPYYFLSGVAGFEGKLCQITICYDDQSDQPWAIEVFKSLTHPAMHDKQEQ